MENVTDILRLILKNDVAGMQDAGIVNVVLLNF